MVVLYSISRMSSVFFHPRNRTFKSHCNTKIKRKCQTIYRLKLLLYFSLFRLLSKINKHKNRFGNLKK